ncbi:MAG: ELWxxDGT repeat protein [Bacteroidota bacterium]
MKTNLPPHFQRTKAMYLMMLCFFSFTPSQAQVQLVKDINQEEVRGYNEYSDFTDVNGTMYFTGKNSELWKSDGTVAGTLMIKKFDELSNLRKSGSTLFFQAKLGDLYGLWKSDGSVAGTEYLKNVSAESLTDVNGTLFFVGTTTANGKEIWKSDGTAAGTILVKDIMRIKGSSNPSLLTNMNGVLFFVANNGQHGYELWKSDGTSAGTEMVKDIKTLSRTSGFPEQLTVINSTLYFTAEDGVLGRELWKTDGTNAGTVIVEDIRPGSAGAGPKNLTAAGSTLYFTANDGAHGVEIWKSDGTAVGTDYIVDLAPGNTGTGFEGYGIPLYAELTNFNGLLYFTAFKNSRHRLWRTDGTAAGTVQMSDIIGVDFEFADYFSNYKRVPYLKAVDNLLYVVVYGDYDELDLWRTDGTAAGTTKLIDPAAYFPYYESYMPVMAGSGGLLYTATQGPELHGFKLYRSDGTAAGTFLLNDIFQPTGDSSPMHLADVNGELYFSTEILTPEYEYDIGLWKTDGTEAGTVRLADFANSIDNLVNVNGTLYFVADEYYYEIWKRTEDGVEAVTSFLFDQHPEALTNINGTLFFRTLPDGLWKSDGTEPGTIMVKNLKTPSETQQSEMVVMNGSIYFIASDVVHGMELWKSDGTEAGTVMVRDIQPPGLLQPAYLTVSNNRLFFIADDGTHGYELWKSDGTAAGTVMVKDIRTGDFPEQYWGWADIGKLENVNGTIYFDALNQEAEHELWKSDGTAAGTVMVKKFYSGANKLHLMKAINNKLVLTVPNAGINEIWVTDGTNAGTMKIGLINSTIVTSDIIDDVLYISTNDGLWRSDGTTCGTFQVEFVGGKFVWGTAVSDGKLFMRAYRADVGQELFVLDPADVAEDPCLTTSIVKSGAEAGRLGSEEQQAATNSEELAHYPNPFLNEFVLNVSGEEGASYDVKITDLKGVSMGEHSGLTYNRDYAFGADWTPGIYLLKVKKENGMIVRKIVKTH